MKPNNWYLLTMQAGKWWEGSVIAEGSLGIFGRDSDANTEWIDVALVMTNEEGDVNALIPTTCGLTEEDLNIGSIQTEMTEGEYCVALALKDVGYDDVSGGPDLGELLTGGTAIMFEEGLMSFEIN